MEHRSRAADLLALVPAAAVPLVFLHVRYQPHASVGPADVVGSDVAIAAVLVAALGAGLRFGWRPLARPRVLWIAAGAFLALIGISLFYRPVEAFSTHATTYAKLVEYALLAPALVLLFRRRAHVERFLVAFVVWCGAASLWGFLQFLGAVKEFQGYRPGQREVSFLGIYDFAVFGAATLAIGLAGIALGDRRRLVPGAAVAGAAGVILAASVFAYSGVVAIAVAAVATARRARLLSPRRLALVAALVVAVGAGVAGLRGSDISNYLGFLGLGRPAKTASKDVETGAQRTTLAYIGLRIWEDHPILGVGFERSANRYQPYLAAARRKFPDQPPQSFPSAAHPWGVQSFWVQLLADEGVVGLALGLATFAAALALAVRARGASLLLRLTAAGFVLAAAGTWIGEGIVTGIPLMAVTWIGFGLAAAVGSLE